MILCLTPWDPSWEHQSPVTMEESIKTVVSPPPLKVTCLYPRTRRLTPRPITNKEVFPAINRAKHEQLVRSLDIIRFLSTFPANRAQSAAARSQFVRIWFFAPRTARYSHSSARGVASLVHHCQPLVAATRPIFHSWQKKIVIIPDTREKKGVEDHVEWSFDIEEDVGYNT